MRLGSFSAGAALLVIGVGCARESQPRLHIVPAVELGHLEFSSGKSPPPDAAPKASSTPGRAPESGSSVVAPGRAPPTVARGTGTAADRQLLQGDRAYAAGDFAAAEKAYREGERLAPADAAPLVGLARALTAKADIPMELSGAPGDPVLMAQVALLERAIRLDSTYAQAYRELGSTRLVLGRTVEARDALRQATSLAPQDAEAHSALGIAHLSLGAIDEAIQAFRRAVALAPNDAEMHANLGTALLASAKVTEALNAYRRAAELAPRDARIQNDLGTTLLAQGQPGLAVPHLVAAIAGNPNRATYRSNLGYAYHLQGDLAKAMSLYREALAMDASLSSAWINLGNALAQLGQRKEAREAYLKAKAQDPDDPRVKAALEDLDALPPSADAPR